MKRFVVGLLVLVGLLGSEAAAQTQPIYTRPAKGDAVVVIPAGTALLTPTTSSVYDFRRFVGAVITLETSGAATQAHCTRVPTIRVYESSTVDGTFRGAFVRNGYVMLRNATTFRTSYYVNTYLPYIKFELDGVIDGGSIPCTAEVKMTAMPVEPVDTPAVFAQDGSGSSVTSVGTTSVTLLWQGQHSATTIQNNGNTAVYCHLSPQARTTMYSVILKASTAANDGTGGSWTVPNYSGPISCIRLSGTGDVAFYSY